MPFCLVIDESSIVVKVASRILAGIEVRTVGAASLAEAETALAAEASPPNLVIVSATLGGPPIETVVRALRARPGWAGTAILVSIIEANLGLMTRSKRAGANSFVFRPFDRASLLAWVDPYLKVAA